MRSYWKAALAATLITLTFANCGDAKNTRASGETINVVHKLGKTDVPVQAKRIVALDIGAVETLLELGVTPAGVPKKFMPNYLDHLKEKESIGDVGGVKEPDLEKINALHPDLILISTRQEKFYDELSAIAPTIFVGVDEKDYLNSFRNNTELLAKITGKEAEAKSKLQQLDEKVASTQAIFKTDDHKAMFLMFNNGKFSLFGKGSRFGFIHDVVGIKAAMEADAGAESVFGQKVSNELIAEANPDYIFLVDRNAAVVGQKAAKEEVENKLIQQTNAYKNGKIFYLEPNVWFISGGGITSMNMMLDDIQKLFKQ